MFSKVKYNHYKMEEHFLEDMNKTNNETTYYTEKFFGHFNDYLTWAELEHKECNYEISVAKSILKTFFGDIVVAIILSVFTEILAISYTYMIRELILYIRSEGE